MKTIKIMLGALTIALVTLLNVGTFSSSASSLEASLDVDMTELVQTAAAQSEYICIEEYYYEECYYYYDEYGNLVEVECYWIYVYIEYEC